MDLRDFPQPLVEVEDCEALDFVTSLIDPDPDVRGKFSISVHDELAVLSRGQLWDFALALSCVMRQDTDRTATSLARPKSEGDFLQLYAPERLAAAGRALLSWPNGFDEMCNKAREDTHLRGSHGVKSELGQIYALRSNSSVDADVREIAKVAINRNMATSDNYVRRVEYRRDDSQIATQAASLRFGIHTKVLKKIAAHPSLTVIKAASATGPRLFLTSELEALSALRDNIDSISAVAVRLGVPTSAVRDIAAAGLIESVDGPVLDMVVGREYFVRKSVDALELAIASKVVLRPVGTHLRLVRAMNRLDSADKPWAELIKAIIDGRLKVFLVEGRLSATLIKLAVSTFDEVQECLIGRGPIKGQLTTLTRPEAGSLLGISVAVVCALVRDKRIEPPATPGGPLRKQAVIDAARAYIFTSEVSRRLKTGPRWVRTKLGEHGVEPIFELEGNRGLAFERPAVEAVIRSMGHE